MSEYRIEFMCRKCGAFEEASCSVKANITDLLLYLHLVSEQACENCGEEGTGNWVLMRCAKKGDGE